ncbi:MAG: outer membrane lipoprotein-sorting protein [Armatimonadetes bacterium]|nr:outer membrane lipoprotein-sorting protein [Armatimonadota bacterium]
MTLLFATAFALVPGQTFAAAVQPKLHDISFTVKLEWSSRAELSKINRDFAMGYEADTAEVQYKDPLMLRGTAKINGQKAIYVIKGDTKTWYVPRLGAKVNQKVGNAPGKRQTLLDFGLVTTGMKDRFIMGKFVRKENGESVFDLHYAYEKDTSRHRVWVDPAKRVITKRMWYSQKGELMATFNYSLHAKFGSVWVPQKMSVRNAEGKLAGVSLLSDIKVNQGIEDSVFNI